MNFRKIRNIVEGFFARILLLLFALSGCTEKPPSKRKVERQRTPPMPVEYLSDYDRKLWEEGCTYDELEWFAHGELDWHCD